jgi:tetratricopeptide (TPR) repeat protein
MNEDLRKHLDKLDSSSGSDDALTNLEDLLTGGDGTVDVETLEVLETKRRKLSGRQEWGVVMGLLELELFVAGELEDAGRELELTYELATTLLLRLHDQSAGLHQLEKVLKLDPDHEEAAKLKAETESVRDRWQDFVERFVAEARQATEPSLKTSLFYRAAEILFRNDPEAVDRVQEHLRASLEADPRNQQAIDLLTVILRRHDAWEEIALLHVEAAEACQSKDDRLRFFKSAARTYAIRTEDKDEAARLFRQVLLAQPGSQGAMSFLADYYDEQGEWDELIELYEEALKGRLRGDAEVAMLFQIGMVHWRKREDPEAAEPFFQRLQKMRPGHAGMLQFYREYAGDAEHSARLLQVLTEAQRSTREASEKVAYGREIAQVAEAGELNLNRAIDSWKQILRSHPGDQEARDGLRRLYRKAQQWNALLDLLKGDIELAPEGDVSARVDVLRQMVEIYRDELHHDKMVINTYNAILRLDPDHEEALEELSEAYQSLGRYSDLTRVLERRAALSEEPAIKVELLSRVAQLWVERFNNLNKAVEPLEKVLEIDPSHADALAQLKQIYTKRRAWKPLFEVVRREADLLEGAERVERLADLARLAADRLDRPAEAVKLWEEVHERNPGWPKVLEELERLTERQRDWAGLARTLERRIEDVDGEQLVPLLTKLGTVYGDRLHDLERSASCWERVLELQPGYPKALRVLREAYVATGNIEALERLYESNDDLDGLVEVLSSAADRVEDAELRVELSFRSADIYETRLDQPLRAQRSYERVLTVDETNERAARALLRIYEKGGQWARLVSMHAILLDHSEPGSEEYLSHVTSLRDLSGDKLSRRDEAFSWAAKAYAAAPEQPELREALEKRAGETDAWEALLEIYEERVEETDDEEEQLVLVRRLAQINTDVLGRTEEAVASYRQLLELKPGDEEALATLERIFAGAGDYDELLKVFRIRLEETEEVAGQCSLLREMARIQEEGLEDDEAAAETYRKVLDLAPGDSAALTALERLATEGEQWSKLAEILRLRREQATDDDVVALTFQLARLLVDELDDAAGAVAELKKILVDHPAHQAALDALEPFLEDRELRADVAAFVEPHLAERQDYERLARVTGILIDEESDDRAKVELLKALALLQVEHLHTHDAALDTLAAALGLAPADLELWDSMDPLAEATDQNDKLARSLAAAYQSPRLEDTARLELASRLADIYDMRLNQPEAARPFHEFVLDNNVGAQRAFDALESLFTTTDRWDDLLALYLRQADRVYDTNHKREILLKICFLFEEVLDQPDDAIEWYVRVMEIDPCDERANSSLELLYAQTERWADLAELLEAKLARAGDEGALDFRFRLGELHESHLNDPTAAIGHYEEVLKADSRHVGVQRALERLLDVSPLRQRAAVLLEPVYEDLQEAGLLVGILRVQLEFIEEPAERVAPLARVGDLLERQLGRPMDAFEAYADAFEAFPVDGRARQELRRLADENELHERYCEVLEHAISVARKDLNDVRLVASLLNEVAERYHRRLQDSDRAEDAFEHLLRLDPDNEEMTLAAARSLEALYLENENWRRLVKTLQFRVGLSDEEEERELLGRIAEIQEINLEKLGDAIATYQGVLEKSPDDLSALRHLERLHERQENWIDLISVLRRRAELTTDEEERRELRFRMASLFEEKQENTDEAVALYRKILSDFNTDRQATQALIRLYESTEHWLDLLDALEADRRLSTDADEQAELLCRMGRLHWRQLNDPARAVQRYAEVVESLPDHEAARRALEQMLTLDDVQLEAAVVLAPLYKSEGQWGQLVSVLELQASAQSAAEGWDLLRQAAEVADVGLEDSRRSFELLARALRAAPDEPHAFEVVERIERVVEATDERRPDQVALYREVVDDVVDTELQLRMMLDVARTSHRVTDELELARDYYDRIVELFGDHEEALDALEEIYQTQGAHSSLLEILRRKVTLAPDDGTRRILWLRQAKLCEVELEDLPEAMRAYESILELDDDREAMASLERIYDQVERYADLAGLLERQLLLVSDAEVIALHYRLGQLHRLHLSDPDGALAHYREALNLDPRHADTVAALEAMMADEDRRGGVAEMLQNYYKMEMNWPRLVESIEARLACHTEAYLRRPLLLEMGTIYEEQLEDLEKAFETYARMFRDEVENPEARDLLSRLANILDAWPRLAEIYAEALDNEVSDTEGTIELAMIWGQIYDVRCDDYARAREAYQRVLRFDPDREEAFKALEALLHRNSAWPELLELYREAADRALGSMDKKDFLFKMAAAQEEKLDDAGAAIEIYREVLDVDEDDERAITALDRLYYNEERWTDLAELFHRRIEQAVDPGLRDELRCSLGGVYEDRLEDVASAVDCYERVLDNSPDHRDALAALERLVLNPDHRYRIAKVLEPIYEAHDEWMKLVVIYDAELEFIADREERVRLRREIARLHEERGGDLDIAFQALAAAFAEAPDDDEILEGLQLLSEKRESWDELVAALDVAVPEALDPERKVTLLSLMAQCQDQNLGDPRAAIGAYRRVLDIDDRDEQALNNLIDLYMLVGDWSGQIEVLERKSEMAEDPEERKDLLQRVGSIHQDMLGDNEKAIDAYRQAYLEDDNDDVTVSALDDLYTDSEQWNELVDLLRRRLDFERDEEERQGILRRVAQIYADELKDAFEATAAYQAVLVENPSDRLALDALDGLHEQAERWADLLEVLERKAESAEDEKDLVLCKLRMGTLQEKQLLEVGSAIETFRSVLEIEPANEDALQALERLAQDEAHRFAAVQALEPLLEDAGYWDRLTKLKELKLEGLHDPLERIGELRSLATIAEEHQQDPSGAFRLHVRALAEDCSDEETHQDLERIAEQLGAWGRLAEAYEERAGSIYDADQVYGLNLRLGRVYEEMLQEYRPAIQAYRRALDAGGDETVPLASLDRLYSREEQWAELAEVLEREMGAFADEEHISQLEYRLGELREERFADRTGAISAYRAIVERQSEHQDARLALERLLEYEETAREVIDVLDPLYRQLEDDAKLVQLHEMRVAMAEEETEKVALLTEMAQLQETNLNDGEAAFRSLAQAFRLDPGDPDLLTDLKRLTEVSNGWSELVKVLDHVLQDCELSTFQARDLGVLAARCYDVHLNEAERAEERYRAVLVLEPENQEVLAALEVLLRQQEKMQPLIPVLRRRAGVEYELDQKKELLAEAAELARGSFGDNKVASECYGAILELDASADFALKALAEIREEQEDWTAVADLLIRRARYCDDIPEAVTLRHRVATLQSGVLEQPERAVETYQEILDADPVEVGALSALEQLYTQLERWQDLQEILVRRLEVAQDQGERIDILLRQAHLAETHFDSIEDAIEALRSVLAMAADHGPAMDHLEDLLGQAEQWEELIDLLELRVENASEAGDSAAELRLLVRMGDLWEQKLSDEQAAIDIYEKVLARDPDHTLALGALARLHEAAGDWERCAEVLERAAKSGGAPADVAEMWFRLGRLNAEQRDDSMAAEQCYRAALEHCPTHGGAAQAVRSLWQRSDNWKAVVDLLELQLREQPEGELSTDIRSDLGEIYLHKLEEPEAAVAHLEQARQEQPQNRDVLMMLVDVYLGAGRHDQAVPVLRNLIEAEEASRKGARSKEMAPYHHRLGQALEASGDREAAKEEYEKAYKMDLGNVEVLKSLGSLRYDDGEYDQAMKIFRGLLLQRVDNSVLNKADIYYKMGQIYVMQEDKRRAMGMFQRGLEADKDHADCRRGLEELKAQK